MTTAVGPEQACGANGGAGAICHLVQGHDGEHEDAESRWVPLPVTPIRRPRCGATVPTYPDITLMCSRRRDHKGTHHDRRKKINRRWPQ